MHVARHHSIFWSNWLFVLYLLIVLFPNFFFYFYRSNDEEIRMAALKQHNYYLSLGYNETNVTVPYIDSHRNIYIFTGIIGGVFIFGMMRALLFFKIAVDASQQLHNNMFTRILRAPISFFDTNPVGECLNCSVFM